MKNIIFVLIILVIGLFAYNGLKDKKADKGNADYEKIEMVKAAMEKVTNSKAVNSFGDKGAWYEFDLRLVNQKTESFYVALRDELGADFDTKLSNGDYIFVGVYPLQKKYRIYADDPADNNNMIYPEWKYSKLPPKTE